MQHQEFEPPEKLQDSIKCFWYDTRDLGELQSGIEVVPDGYAEIIFYCGSILNISYDGGLQALPSPFMIGLLNQPVVFHTQNRLEIIGIRCFPWAVFDLLGLPAGKDGVRIFEHPITRLQSSMSNYIQAGKIEEALGLVKQFFLDTRSQVAADRMLFKAGAAMREANGTIPVSKIAEAANATIRTLERNFKRSSGFTVKDVSGLIRFEQVRNQLLSDPKSNIAGVAHEFGYTDQSHLIREFKRYSATTPAAFVRKGKQDKQAISKDFVAFIQS